MAFVVFSAGERCLKHLYDIDNNKDYYACNKFLFAAPYQFLVAHSSLTFRARLADDEPAATEVIKKRSIGTKAVSEKDWRIKRGVKPSER